VCPGEPHKVLNNATESKTKNVDVGTKIFVIQIQLGICIAFWCHVTGLPKGALQSIQMATF